MALHQLLIISRVIDTVSGWHGLNLAHSITAKQMIPKRLLSSVDATYSRREVIEKCPCTL